MSIEAATGALALLITVASAVLGMFVKNKVADCEDKILDSIAKNYMPREVAMDRFNEISRRLERIDGNPTPRAPRPTIERPDGF